jgi:hypothetical protein
MSDGLDFLAVLLAELDSYVLLETGIRLVRRVGCTGDTAPALGITFLYSAQKSFKLLFQLMFDLCQVHRMTSSM